MKSEEWKTLLLILNTYPLILNFIRQRIHLHLLKHGGEPVGSCGRKVVAQTYLFDEIEIGRENVFRCLVVEHAQEQGDNTFNDECIAFRLEMNKAVDEVCL